MREALAEYLLLVRDLALKTILWTLALIVVSSTVNLIALRGPDALIHSEARGSLIVTITAVIAAVALLRGLAWLPAGMIAAGSISNASWIELHGGAPDWIVISQLGIIINYADLLIALGMIGLIAITLTRAYIALRGSLIARASNQTLTRL